ncbi:MAG: response regulator transcription factor [Chloroflexi bacterium]|nr:response regulator transcription factor [Chloroflexota bacterium]
MNERILVVDDEEHVAELLRMILEREQFEVVEASDGREALEKVRDELPDIVILDVMMPEMDGFETLREIRQSSTVPVIMLTVQAGDADRVRGLELGADDYVAKPFNHRELVGRVRAVLRRTRMIPSVVRASVRIDDDLSIDFDRRQAVVRGVPVRLRPTEFKLLYHLVNNAGRLLSHESLLTKVWGREYRDDTQLLRLYITYLRQKIEADSANPKYILNERGLGYRFIEPNPESNESLTKMK